MKRRWWCILMGTAVIAAACGSDAGPRGARASSPDVALLTVDTATLNVPLAIAAQLYVEHDARVYARSAGIVESVFVDLGTAVTEGQPLAQLEHVDQEIALARAEQDYARAEREVARSRDLAHMGGISAADSETAEVNYQQTSLARRQAKRNLDLTRIVAPFAGVVTARTVRPRQLVAAGDSLFRVSALGPLRVSVRVPETAPGIRIGGAVQVVGLDGTTAAATIIRGSPTIDPASGTREFLLQLSPGSGLRPGAAVTVHLGAERRTVVAIPRDAIAEQGYVLVSDGGRTLLRSVTLGATLPDGRIEVVSGLSPGERLVRGAK